jgi:5-methylthioadenosine/S-adenosylhomocysteine deaminase
VIAAHCVHIDNGEIRTLKNAGAGISHNPSSNLKLASGIAPVTNMLKAGVNVGIGTDGPASNNDLDMIEETRLAAFIAKVKEDDPTALPAKLALAMATSMGARALHMGDLVGSLETEKRADIIVIDLRRVHNWPAFRRNPDSIYSQIVYAAKSTDITWVMCNGQWLLKNGTLQTLSEIELFAEAEDLAHRIDTFLMQREGDVLSKLLALGELHREESFEVQVKAKVANDAVVERLVAHSEIEVIRRTHYIQYDTYFIFGSPEQARLRYREDYNQDADAADALRARLTLTGAEVEQEFSHSIMLSRSRFISSATRPMRFYREYFQPEIEQNITKERRRWHINFRGRLFYVNLDQVTDPEQDGYFLEVKSRTWSQTDATAKATMIEEMLAYINISDAALIRQEYVKLIGEQ